MNLRADSVRQEVKYKVFVHDLPHLLSWLCCSSSFRKSYASRMVSSVYYDTPNYNYAASNMSGESRRIKIRSRWYSRVQDDLVESFCSPDQEFFFEMKRKLNNNSDKIVLGNIRLPGNDSFCGRLDSLAESLSDYQSELQEISHFNLRDVVMLSYVRDYYEDKFCKSIRLTIDRDIGYVKTRPQSKLYILSKDYVIAELKFREKDSQRVTETMSKFPFRKTRSSKYIAAMSQLHRISY